jgi:hypothetical protein
MGSGGAHVLRGRRDPDMDISMIWSEFEELLKPETGSDKEDEDSKNPDVED